MPGVALLDVDNTLLFQDPSDTQSTVLNITLLRALKQANITDICFFTHLPFTDKNFREPTRDRELLKQSIEKLQLGFTVHLVITPNDIFWGPDILVADEIQPLLYLWNQHCAKLGKQKPTAKDVEAFVNAQASNPLITNLTQYPAKVPRPGTAYEETLERYQATQTIPGEIIQKSELAMVFAEYLAQKLGYHSPKGLMLNLFLKHNQGEDIIIADDNYHVIKTMDHFRPVRPVSSGTTPFITMIPVTDKDLPESYYEVYLQRHIKREANIPTLIFDATASLEAKPDPQCLTMIFDESKVSESQLKALVDQTPNLRNLTIKRCANITINVLLEIQATYPKLQIIAPEIITKVTEFQACVMRKRYNNALGQLQTIYTQASQNAPGSKAIGKVKTCVEALEKEKADLLPLVEYLEATNKLLLEKDNLRRKDNSRTYRQNAQKLSGHAHGGWQALGLAMAALALIVIGGSLAVPEVAVVGGALLLCSLGIYAHGRTKGLAKASEQLADMVYADSP